MNLCDGNTEFFLHFFVLRSVYMEIVVSVEFELIAEFRSGAAIVAVAKEWGMTYVTVWPG